jgi:hypothetical protein
MKIDKRLLYLGGGSILAFLGLYLTDPDGGAITTLFGLQMATPVIAVWFAHLMRKALLNYEDADMDNLFTRAKESATGAGLALLSMSIVIYGLLNLFGKAS